MKALVTGADGFVGRWLVKHLEASGDEVWEATGIRGAESPRRRPMDLLDQRSVRATIAWASPQAIYHLAAVAFGPDATADLGRAIDVTVRGTAFVLESAAALDRPPIAFIPSSSEVYGRAEDGAIAESHERSPTNAYGATKLAQETFGLAFHQAGRLRVAVARAFNHIGPGQRASFVVPSFAAQLAEIAAGRAEAVLRVGNLEAVRDFTDVRDVVRAYRLLVAGEHAGEAINVASGRDVAIRSLLRELIALSGLSVTVIVDPSRIRPGEPAALVGSSARLHALTGWSPRITLDQTLRDVWTDARERAFRSS